MAYWKKKRFQVCNILWNSWVPCSRNYKTRTLYIFCRLVELWCPGLRNDYRLEYLGCYSGWKIEILGMSPFSGDNEDILYKSILHDKVQYTSKMDRESKSFCEKVINFKFFFFASFILTNFLNFLDFGAWGMTLWKFIFSERFHFRKPHQKTQY